MYNKLLDTIICTKPPIQSSLKYNIFKTLKLSIDETRLHSRFISDLLRPNGKHNEGCIFLKSFFRICLKKTVEDDESIEVITEYFIEKIEKPKTWGRIDILITNNNMAIAIENKIYAIDQPKQLERYANYLKHLNTKQNKRTTLIYLTLNGKQLSSYSSDKLVVDKDYICLSYNKDIRNWITDCIEIAKDDRLKDCLRQYIEVLDSLTRSFSMINAIEEIIFEKNQEINTNYIIALKEIMNNSKRIETSIVLHIISKIENCLQEVLKIETKKETRANDSVKITYEINSHYSIRFKYIHHDLYYGISSGIIEDDKVKLFANENFNSKSNDFLAKKKTNISFSSNIRFPKNLQEEIDQICTGIKKLIEIANI